MDREPARIKIQELVEKYVLQADMFEQADEFVNLFRRFRDFCTNTSFKQRVFMTCLLMLETLL